MSDRAVSISHKAVSNITICAREAVILVFPLPFCTTDILITAVSDRVAIFIKTFRITSYCSSPSGAMAFHACVNLWEINFNTIVITAGGSRNTVLVVVCISSFSTSESFLKRRCKKLSALFSHFKI